MAVFARSSFCDTAAECEPSVVCPPDKLRKHAFTGRIFINDCDDRRRKVRISTPIDTMAAHMAALPLTQASFVTPNGTDVPTDQVPLHQCKSIRFHDSGISDKLAAVAPLLISSVVTPDGKITFKYHDVLSLLLERCRFASSAEQYALIEYLVDPCAMARAVRILLDKSDVVTSTFYAKVCHRIASVLDADLSQAEADGLKFASTDLFKLHEAPGGNDLGTYGWQRAITFGSAGLTTGGYCLGSFHLYHAHTYEIAYSAPLGAVKDKAKILGLIPADELDLPENEAAFMAAATINCFARYQLTEPSPTRRRARRERLRCSRK